MRLIDAKEMESGIKEAFKENPFLMGMLLRWVRKHPTIDAVPVVRCKDCNNYADAIGKDSGKPCGYGQCKWPTGIRGIVCADDYCSFGERKDGSGNE